MEITMDIKQVIELIQQMEADDTLPYTSYLTDGDEDLHHPSVKAVTDAFHYAPDVSQRKEMELAGYPFWPYGDCWSFQTKKGMFNTGHDRM